jgi:hypothetical protein
MRRVWQRVVATAGEHRERGVRLSEPAARGLVLRICDDEHVVRPDEGVLSYLAYAMSRRTFEPTRRGPRFEDACAEIDALM